MDRIFLSLIGIVGFLLAMAGSVYFGLNIYTTVSLGIFATAFFATIFFTGAWVKIAQNGQLTGRDINKHNGGQVAESGGMGLILGISVGLLAYVFIKTFFIGTETNLTIIMAMLITILLSGILGFIDDIIGWKTGLRQWQKPLLTLPIAIPLMVVNAGNTFVDIPFVGSVDLGILYAMILIPIGVVGAANGFNMLAGINGLEAGLGAIILSSMGVIAYASGAYWLVIVIGVIVSALIGFLIFNKYPAKVFPGDSLTYSIGATIAGVAVVGSMQKAALILFGLYFIELILKARVRFKGESFGIAQPNGTIKSPQKIISMTHVSMRILEKVFGRATERTTVYLLYAMQALLAVIAVYVTVKGF